MKAIALAAALATMIAAVPVQAAGWFGDLPTTFYDQGRQVPAFPGDR